MNKFMFSVAKWTNKILFNGRIFGDKSKSGSSGGTRDLTEAAVARITYKAGTSDDFEDPDYNMDDIKNGYNTDSYIRQGVDKYVDQIFKEGYSFYGNNQDVVDYIKTRLSYIAEGTSNPTNGFLIEIAEDLVKYGNCMIVKARGNDPNTLPQGTNIQGIYGSDPVVGYFVVDPASMKCKRDKFGTITSWQQENEEGSQIKFDPQDVIHMYYKRERGKAYGTSFLIPVLDDVRALRQAEENVLKMMYRHIYPFYHVAVGSKEAPGSDPEVDAVKTEIDQMDAEGGLVTTERVVVTPIASDKVIDASPYLSYMENRVFTGMGIPAIMFGRGDTSNRSTGDNMTSEMADRIRALCKTIEMFINQFIIKELLMEGGYDPVLNPDDAVQFQFNDNDVDVKIKKDVHAIYKYEHNAVTENEMRAELGLDPIPDGERGGLFVELITRETLRVQSELSGSSDGESNKDSGTKETNNKQKNSGGKPSSKKSKDFEMPYQSVGVIKDYIDIMRIHVDEYINDCYKNNHEVLQQEIQKRIVDCNKNIIYTINKEKSFENADFIKRRITSSSLALLNGIHRDLIGQNTNVTSQDNVIDFIHGRIDIFTDSSIQTLSQSFDRKDKVA